MSSPWAQRTHSQCIPSSETSEASEMLSPLEPLSLNKSNKEKINPAGLTEINTGDMFQTLKAIIIAIIVNKIIITVTSSGTFSLQNGPLLWAGRNLAHGLLNPTLSTDKENEEVSDRHPAQSFVYVHGSDILPGQHLDHKGSVGCWGHDLACCSQSEWTP